MQIVAIVVVSVVVAMAALLPLGLFVRCRKVDAMRSQKLRESYDQATADMNAGHESWEWRFDAYQKGPTFTEMVWKIWRPVSSFYEPRGGRVTEHPSRTPGEPPSAAASA